MTQPVESFKTLTLTLPDGRQLGEGDEFTVAGVGRFSFRYGWRQTEVTCFGPVNKPIQGWRTFAASAITTVHRKQIHRKETT